MKPDFRAYWVDRDRVWLISYKKTDGGRSTISIPRTSAKGPAAQQAADRYAEAWYANYSRNAGRVQGFEPPTAADTTTQTEWESWIEEREKNPKIKQATIKQNKGHKDLIFNHPMSQKPLRLLSAPEGCPDAKAFILYARDGGNGRRAAYTVRNIVNSYSAFLGSRFEVAVNPFHHRAVREHLPSPKPKWGRDKPHIAPDDIPRFILCDSPAIPKWRWVKHSMAALGGAREGELQGLRWKHVYFEHKIPHYKLTEQLALVTKMGHAQIDALKSEASFRLVPLHPLALERLRWWRETGWEQWTKKKPTREDFVFANEKGDSWRPKAAAYLRQDLGAAKLDTFYNGHPLTEHALRRTFSTLLHQAGVPVTTITEILGHADGSTAMDHYIFKYLEPHAAAIARIQIGEMKSTPRRKKTTK